MWSRTRALFAIYFNLPEENYWYNTNWILHKGPIVTSKLRRVNSEFKFCNLRALQDMSRDLANYEILIFISFL